MCSSFPACCRRKLVLFHKSSFGAKFKFYLFVSYSSEVRELVMPMASSLPLIAEADLVKLHPDLAKSGCSQVDPGLLDFPDVDDLVFDDDLESRPANDSVPSNHTDLKGEEVDTFLELMDSTTWALADWFNWLEHQITGYGFWPPFGLCLILILVLYLAWVVSCCRRTRFAATSLQLVATGPSAGDPQNPSPAGPPSVPQVSPQHSSSDHASPQDLPLPLEVPKVFSVDTLAPSGSGSDSSIEQPPPPVAPALDAAPPLGSSHHRRPASLNLAADYPLVPTVDVEAQTTAGRIICTEL